MARKAIHGQPGLLRRQLRKRKSTPVKSRRVFRIQPCSLCAIASIKLSIACISLRYSRFPRAISKFPNPPAFRWSMYPQCGQFRNSNIERIWRSSRSSSSHTLLPGDSGRLPLASEAVILDLSGLRTASQSVRSCFMGIGSGPQSPQPLFLLHF